MLPYSNQPDYLQKELKLQAQQGRDLEAAAQYLNADLDELDAWCRAGGLPQGQDYNSWAAHVRSKYESDLLFAQQKLAAGENGKNGSPVAQRTLLKHLGQRRPRPAVAAGGLLLPELEPTPGALVQVGTVLLLAGEVLTARPTNHYNYTRCVMEYGLVINPGMSERTPYANLTITFPTRLARDQAEARLTEARLHNPADPLVLVEPVGQA